jgi:hypothetical protein
MTNRIRGEASLEAGGTRYRLLLTLGALAEIEDGLALANLSEIGARLKEVRAADLAIVAAALLRGGGHDVTSADVLRLPCDLGALTSAVIAAFDAAATKGGEGQVPFPGNASWSWGLARFICRLKSSGRCRSPNGAPCSPPLRRGPVRRSRAPVLKP